MAINKYKIKINCEIRSAISTLCYNFKFLYRLYAFNHFNKSDASSTTNLKYQNLKPYVNIFPLTKTLTYRTVKIHLKGITAIKKFVSNN